MNIKDGDNILVLFVRLGDKPEVKLFRMNNIIIERNGNIFTISESNSKNIIYLEKGIYIDITPSVVAEFYNYTRFREYYFALSNNDNYKNNLKDIGKFLIENYENDMVKRITKRNISRILENLRVIDKLSCLKPETPF